VAAAGVASDATKQKRATSKLQKHLRLVGPDDTSFGLLQGRYELHVGGRSPGDGIGVEERSVQQLLTTDLHVE
jgi:hypothetical protein